ncbi:putative indole-3-pyruvate monooxygenase YUCCA8 [Sparassis crispa]|uniref:Putative indole-3-pyruvate monooxygenase YUCCA8 n=1 Tax=Sparassis crispa TaxID=139825 RepID=A0A401G9B8_9APHY|nr:putative indole-3-pyruvate monooxygenase YUCCA8 [Sparassis crispa]GBE78764.1 putative indole-3-pyruvate monooxygenase YUCCA8 [Sparassis crispa]
MSDTPKPSLPTLDKLGVTIPDDLDVQAVASGWFNAFSQQVSAHNVPGVLSLFVDDGWWRDMLALTWEFRTFHGAKNLQQFFEDRLAASKFSELKLGTTSLEKYAEDVVFLEGFFTFETDVGIGSGIFRLVPSESGTWKAHHVYTNLEELKGFPEKTGSHRNFLPNHGKWLEQRAREREFLDADPKVIVIGGGQSGLDVAARLKLLDVPTLVVEKRKRIGDLWRHRYQALCLHDPVWYDHLPYIPFPSSWPVYTPAQKLADWLEFYAESMEINVWTSSTLKHFEQREDKTWDVTVERADGSERKLHVDHVVLALGLGAGSPNMPSIPGREEFQGQVLHSTEHNSAKDHLAKKVLIIGASTSAHDIAGDYVDHGVDVTLYQRSPTHVMSTRNGMPKLLDRFYWQGRHPTEVADRLNASFPTSLQVFFWRRIIDDIAQADKPLLDGLHKVGFKTYAGSEGAGFIHLSMTRGGGYYLDVGTSQLIVDGKIKLKNDSPIERFIKTGIRFEDGSEVNADVVMFATGFDSPISAIAKLAGEELASKITPIWGLNEEGELRSAWRWLGVQNLWFMMGNLSWCRFHSKHLALQIKAIQEGVYGERYTT